MGSPIESQESLRMDRWDLNKLFLSSATDGTRIKLTEVVGSNPTWSISFILAKYGLN